MAARKELGSFRRGEMSLARKHRPGDSGVGFGRGDGGPLGQSPRAPRPPHSTRGTTAQASGANSQRGPQVARSPVAWPRPRPPART